MRVRFTAPILFALATCGALAPANLVSAFQQAGSKIWVGRHAEIEDFIRNAKIDHEEEIKLGVTKPHRLYLEPGPVASVAWSNLHGRYMGFWDSYKADIAAYEVDKLLQLDMVPPIVEKRYKNDLGRASMWVENVKMWDAKQQQIAAPDPLAFQTQVVRMKMFDNFIGNTDRNAGNLLIDPAYNLILIDHTRAFTAGNKLVVKMTRVDRELWTRMLALTEQQLKDAIGKWVMGSQIKDVFKRRDQMAAEIAKLPTT